MVVTGRMKKPNVILVFAVFMIVALGVWHVIIFESDMFTIGIVSFSKRFNPIINGFKDGLAKRGYVEGTNIKYVYNDATFAIEDINAAVQILLDHDVDLILSVSTPVTIRIKKQTKGLDVPVVFVPIYDPVKNGIVKSIINPSGNLTGIRVRGFVKKTLEWHLAINSQSKQLFVPYSPHDNVSVMALNELKIAATKHGVELVTVAVNSTNELNQALESIPKKVNGIFLLPGGLRLAYIDNVIKIAKAGGLLISGAGSHYKIGAVVSYGPDFYDIGKQASRLAHRILQGNVPSNLPIETAEFYLGINLKVARQLGIKIPIHVSKQAHNIIQPE